VGRYGQASDAVELGVLNSNQLMRQFWMHTHILGRLSHPEKWQDSH
jgi:hypothetical protein